MTVSAWIAALLAQNAAARTEAAGCAPLADSDFKITTLISRDAQNQLEEPIKMALDMDDQGRIDIYFVQRYGKIRKYSIATRQLTTIGTLNVADVKLEDGVTGIILDPGFKSNRWLYLYYGRGTDPNFQFKLSRFKLDAAGMLDMASERPILVIPGQKGQSHTGGSMRFDAQGNLYLGVGDNHLPIVNGDNSAGELTAPNTNDLRGKILRFKPISFPDAQTPTPGAGTTYTIPDGNLFPVGTAKTRPEIYIMGDRNPYTLSLDSRTKQLAWGEMGPNFKTETEEHDITSKPGNFGFPYYAGNQLAITPNAGTPDKPQNNNPKNTGLRDLPPAMPPAHAYLESASITGPIFRYDEAPEGSTVKFPPQFDGSWFVSDYLTGEIDTIQLDASRTKMTAFGRVFPKLRLDNPLDFQQGPDGALYVVNYGGYFTSTNLTALVRIEYSGPCRPAPSATMPIPKRQGAAPISVDGFALEVLEAGPHLVEIADLNGRIAARYRGNGRARYDSYRDLGGRPGLYSVRFEGRGETRSKLMLVGR
jgi:cytochrome c